jgi:Xaa-Pro aminopeptidase
VVGELTEAEALRHALVREKHEQATSLLAANGIDCWLTFCREGSDLLLPFVTGAEYIAGLSALMLFADGSSAAVVADYDVQQVSGLFEEVHAYSLDWKEPFLETLSRRSPGTIAVNYSETDHGVDGLTHGLHRRLDETLGALGHSVRMVSSAPVAGPVRAIKTPAEIERIRRACEVTARIFDDVTGMARPGLTEWEVADLIRERMQSYQVEPAWEAAICPSVTGSKSPRGHAPPTAARIESGEVMAIDFGVRYEGYVSDLQRSWYFRKLGERQPPPEVQRQFDAVRDAISLAEAALRPGVTGVEVDTAARELIERRGYRFTHALGHQIGRTVHDGGLLLGPNNARYADRSGGTVAAGMVFTLEPVIGQIGLEENVVVTDTGCEYLVAPQRELYLI